MSDDVENEACPCLHTTPCHKDCTCVNQLSSRGCDRCCTYGSVEQQKKKASWLAKIIDAEVRRVKLEKARKGETMNYFVKYNGRGFQYFYLIADVSGIDDAIREVVQLLKKEEGIDVYKEWSQYMEYYTIQKSIKVGEVDEGDNFSYTNCVPSWMNVGIEPKHYMEPA